MSENTTENNNVVMNIKGILEHLPHRYPFLLIDRVTEFVPFKSIKGYKNVTFNEPYFTGHFPVSPVMPGVLIIEALAQATGILAFKSTETKPSDGTLYYLVGVDETRFKQPVEPGDQLMLEVELIRNVRNIWRFSAKASVDGNVVATAKLMCASKEIED